MDKQTYYVLVQAGEIFSDPTYETYDYIIEATKQEVNELQELLDKAHENDGDTFIRSQTPYIQYHNDRGNHEYDESLKQIFSKIYELGNDVSRQHIESMGILDN